ncbi:MAG: uL14 family ribosomal protein [Candidatus Micrarchaeia archaeon]|jgi:large subunit ribosomal protein L14
MKGIATKIPKSLPIGAYVKCIDNSGAKVLYIIGVLGWKGKHNRMASAGIGNIVIASVKKGNEKMVKKIVKAIIVRQKKEIRRANGIRIKFDDNAAVIVDVTQIHAKAPVAGGNILPVGTEIKGVIPREIAELYPKVAAIATKVV